VAIRALFNQSTNGDIMKVIIKFEDVNHNSEAFKVAIAIANKVFERSDLELLGLKLTPMSASVDSGHCSEFATFAGAMHRVAPMQSTIETEFLILEESKSDRS
jgi:hypothetical protein